MTGGYISKQYVKKKITSSVRLKATKLPLFKEEFLTYCHADLQLSEIG